MLTNEEVKEKLAERFYNKRRLGVLTDDRGSSAENDIQSGLAEKYAADFLGCEFNCDVLDGNDGHYDFIYKGYKTDVKWMGFLRGTKEPRNSGRIIVDIHKLGIADIYIAVAGSEETGYKILGWCWREELKNEPLWKSNFPDQNGKYERYAIHTSKLRKI